jgi:hypothetical protein
MRRLWSLVTVSLVALVGTLCADTAVFAQGGSVPAMQWGTFNLNISERNCSGRAKKALADAGLAERQESGWSHYGHSQHAAVLVTCVPLSPQSVYVIVLGSSTDGKAAELIRNDIRARIQSMREFD